MNAILPLSSWVVFGFALAIVVQNLIYISKGHKRRPNLHFVIGLLGVYFAGVYFLAAIDPTNRFIEILSKVGIITAFVLDYKITKSDKEDYRLDDRIGRR